MLRFGFHFGLFGAFRFLPVHVRKRKSHLKPATVAEFLSNTVARAVLIPEAC